MNRSDTYDFLFESYTTDISRTVSEINGDIGSKTEDIDYLISGCLNTQNIP